MKKLIGYIIAVVLFTACAKNKSNEVVVTGRLMQSCDTPAANKEGTILTADAILSGPGHIIDFTTDENGYFEARHSGSGFTRFTVRVEGSSDVLKVDYLSGDKKELGEVYINPFPTNFIIHLDVKNPYTENDTLVMMDYGNPDPLAQRYIPGPFESGFFDSVVKQSYTSFPLKWDQISDGSTPEYSIGFHFRDENGWDGTKEKVVFNITPICSGEFTDVTLVID